MIMGLATGIATAVIEGDFAVEGDNAPIFGFHQWIDFNQRCIFSNKTRPKFDEHLCHLTLNIAGKLRLFRD